MDKQSKPFGIGGYNNKGRIIFLGDGTEVLTDSDDAEMFDNAEEDKDLASQVSKSSSAEEDPKAAVKSTEASESKTESTSKDTPAEETKKEAAKAE